MALSRPPASSSARDPLARPARGSLKGALALLVALMLGLLLWQLHQETRQLEDAQRMRSQEHASQLANYLSLVLRLKAEAGRAFLATHAESPPTEAQLPDLSRRLHGIYPALHSLAWYDAQGRQLLDTAPGAPQARQLPAGESFHFSYVSVDGGLILLLIEHPQARGRWLVRLRPAALNNWLPQQDSNLPWLLQDSGGHTMLRPPLAATPAGQASQLQSIATLPLNYSDWQIQALFDAARLRSEMLPLQAGKLLLFILCAALALLALFGLLREQRSLRAYHALSRQAMEDALGALGAIDECVLVTQPDGRISYLNPRAERMFGLDLAGASQMHVLELLPALRP